MHAYNTVRMRIFAINAEWIDDDEVSLLIEVVEAT